MCECEVSCVLVSHSFIRFCTASFDSQLHYFSNVLTDRIKFRWLRSEMGNIWSKSRLAWSGLCNTVFNWRGYTQLKKKQYNRKNWNEKPEKWRQIQIYWFIHMNYCNENIFEFSALCHNTEIVYFNYAIFSFRWTFLCVWTKYTC